MNETQIIRMSKSIWKPLSDLYGGKTASILILVIFAYILLLVLFTGSYRKLKLYSYLLGFYQKARKKTAEGQLQVNLESGEPPTPSKAEEIMIGIVTLMIIFGGLFIIYYCIPPVWV